MIVGKFFKQPRENKDYDIDYSPWLDTINDTLSEVYTSVECITNPEDNSLVVSDVHRSYDLIKLWLEGGTAGERYKVTITVHTNKERIDENELIFTIKDF